MKYLIGIMLASLILALPGCGQSASDNAATQPATAPVANTQSSDRVLNLYIWSEYMPDSVLEKFTQRTGIKVKVDNYSSNEELLQKLKSGVAGYDLCVPSDYMVKRLIDNQLIRPLDQSRLTNLKNDDPRFLNRKFDPGNRYSIPYHWGTTGLGFNKECAGGPIDSWQAVFDPKFKDQVLMLNDMRECFGVALKSMGKSLNSTDPADLLAAAELLKKQKAQGIVKLYDSDDYDNKLLNGDVTLAHGYNGQLAKVVSSAPAKFGYVIPKEGCTLWMDGICVPAKAHHYEEAMTFLNFVLEPEVAAEIVNSVNYASANAAARAFIKPEILSNTAIYPSDEMLKKCEMMEDLGAATTVMDRYWTEIKAQ